MENTRMLFLPFAAAFLLFIFSVQAWASEKIAVVQYELKPVESVDSGRYIKTEWNAKIRNRASEPVQFSVTIVFIGAGNETLKEATCQCELKAQETRSFKDTVLVESSLANRIASTHVRIDEIEETPSP